MPPGVPYGTIERIPKYICMAETIFSGEIPSPLGRYAKIPPSLDKAFESGGIDTGKDITRGELDALRAACSQSLSLCGERVELPQGITVERRFSGGTLEAYVLHPPAGGKFVVGSSTYPEAYIIQQDGKFYVHIDSGNRYASLRELVAQLPSLMRTTDSRMAEVVRARSEEIRTLGRDLCDAYRVLYEARRRGARGESLEDS